MAAKKSFNKLSDMLAESGVQLRPGDRVKLYDLSCITLSTMTLVRAMSKMLREGIAFEIISAGIVIEPDADNMLHAMLHALDAHYRFLHGIKIHAGDRRGRRRLLDPNQLPTIRAELDKPGVTATHVAQQLGVARSTLFNFLERCDQERRSSRGKTDQREPERLGDAALVLAGHPGKADP